MAGFWPFMSEVLMCRFLGLRTRLKQSVNQPGRDRSVSGLGCNGRALVIAPKVLTRRSLGWRTRLKQSVNQPGRDRSVSGLGCNGRALVIAPKVLTRRSLGWQTRLKQSVNQPHVQLTKVSQEASPLLVQSLLVLFLVQSGRQLDHHDQPKTS